MQPAWSAPSFLGWIGSVLVDPAQHLTTAGSDVDDVDDLDDLFFNLICPTCEMCRTVQYRSRIGFLFH